MKRLLSLLIKEGMELLVAAELRRARKRLATFMALATVLGVLGAAALSFFYLLLYRLLSERLDDIRAAAILCGGNLVLIALVIAVRALTRGRGSGPSGRSLTGDSAQSALDLSESALDAGIALGQELNERARKAAPTIVLVAALVGIVIGLRPQILTIFRRAPAKTPRP